MSTIDAMKDNRWEPAPDEFAVFLRIGQLSGIFSKVLHVGAGTSAFVIQDGQVRGIVPPGDHTVESFFSRLNNFFQDQHAEILITRQAALPISMTLKALTAEFLEVDVNVTLSVKVGDIASFSSRFMTAPGVVTVDQLRDLLKLPVQQTIGEFMGARSLREMAGQPTLRDELNQMLAARLRVRFNALGLAIDAIDAFELRHDKFGENRALQGSLWLFADEIRVHIEHRKQIDELYSLEEWRKIKREEEDVRLRLRRSELKADEGERAHVVRMREIELLGRVVEADTREAAIKLNAMDALEEIDHEITKRGWDRQDEAARWAHAQELARIKLQVELEISEAQKFEATETEKLRVLNVIDKINIRNQFEQAQLTEDEDIRKERVGRARSAEAAVHLREGEIKDEWHKHEVMGIRLEERRRQLEFERINGYADTVNESRKREITRKDGAQDFDEERRQLSSMMELREQKRQADWRIELERIEADRLTRRQDADLERDKLEALSKVPLDTLIAVAQDPKNIAALTSKAELDALRGMSADEIQSYALLRAPDALKAKYSQPGETDAQRMQQLLDMQRQHTESMMGFAEKALKQVGDTAQGVAQAGAGHTVIGVAGIGQASASVSISCPQCHHVNLAGARFCSACAAKLT